MIMMDAITADPAAIEEVKAYLRVAHADDDAAIGTLVGAALAHGEAFLGQVLIARGVSERMPAAGGWRRLSRTPVGAVTEVAGEAGQDAPSALPAAAYAIDIDASGDGWVRMPAPGTATRLSVRYTAGIASAWSGLPEPIRQGVVRLASHLYTHRDAADEGAPPAAVAALWRPWRRMRLA